MAMQHSTRAALPVPPQHPNALAIKALWREVPDLSAGMALETKLAALRYASAGIDPREALGRAAYESDVEGQPLYHDGQPRRAWSAIGEPERETWRRNPTARAFPRSVRI